MKINKSTIRKTIGQGKTELAIRMLLKLTEKFDERIYNNAILLLSRINSLTKDQMNGTISNENINMNKNRINYALSQTLDEIDDAWEVEDSTINR